MRKAYYTLVLTDAVLLKDRLVQNGIAASVRNKGAVRIPHDGIASEVWIADDANDERVGQLIRAFLAEHNGVRVAEPSWKCRSCGEESPGEFEVCWKCSQERAATAALA